ncbi:MAG: beta-mannanase [Candidatus Dormibacteraeota bacterium]|nr:beta-mannanase [Candidatus Dormibacteraeota bacterium]
MAYGLVEDGWPASTNQYRSTVAQTHRTPQYMEWYFHWGGAWSGVGDAMPFIHASRALGATPIVTWMSDDPSNPSATPFTLAGIASGAFDSYIASWASQLRSVGGAVILRLDPEMNGNWMAWSSGRAGQQPADYVGAWRHVHDVFRAQRAGNVLFMWSPNVEYPSSVPLAALYPGDAFVDWAALDGYNWGTSYGHGWQTFSQVFDSSIAAVRRLTARPFLIAEVACAEAGGNKAAWIAGMFEQLRAQPWIRAFVWFDLDKENDWRINSSPAAAASFDASLA